MIQWIDRAEPGFGGVIGGDQRSLVGALIGAVQELAKRLMVEALPGLILGAWIDGIIEHARSLGRVAVAWRIADQKDVVVVVFALGGELEML